MYEAQKRWLAKPGNREKQRAASARCRARPHAQEAHRAHSRRYAAAHREQERLRAANWRKNNPDLDRDMRRGYYLRNADKVRARNKAYRLANPEKYRELSREYKRRKRGGGRMPAGYVSRLWAKQSGLCNACRGSLTILGYHVDHIVAVSNGGKHVEGNVQLLCPSDNRRKAAKDFAAFLREF